MDYEVFSAPFMRAITLANQEAMRVNHEYIGTEHILLGLIKQDSGLAADVLKQLAIDTCDIPRTVETLLNRLPVPPDALQRKARAKKVIEYSVEEARNANQKHVGIEHLLLGLLREGEGVAAQVLNQLGVTIDRVRELLQTRPDNDEANPT